MEGKRVWTFRATPILEVTDSSVHYRKSAAGSVGLEVNGLSATQSKDVIQHIDELYNKKLREFDEEVWNFLRSV